MSFPKTARNIQSKGGNNGSGSGGLGPSAFGKAVSAAIRSDFGAGASAVKTVALLTGANERAVKNWLQGRNAPNGYFLAVLAGHSAGVFRLVMACARREDTMVALEVGLARAALVEALAALDAYR